MHCLHRKKDFELRKKKRDSYLAAISRKDIDTTALYKYRICSRHFAFENQLHDLYDSTNPGRLSTLDLGYENMGIALVHILTETLIQ